MTEREDRKWRADWLVNKEGWERSHAEEELGLNRKRGFNNDYQSGEKLRGTIVAEYIYKDEHGQNHSRVQRTDEKQFPQSWWNPAVSYWVYGQHKGEKIPYRLPELLAAPANEPVWDCEGEKDADTAAALGLVATTHSGGAGKWKPEINRWFAGKKIVYVVEDDDPPGRHCAAMRARQLSTVVEQVRIVSFADLDGIKDLTEFVEAGHTKEELLERATVFQPRVVVRIAPGQIARIVDEAQRALIAAGQPIFVRAGRLVEPVWSEYKTRRREQKTKVTVLRPHYAETLIYALNKHAAIFERFDLKKQSWVEADPPLEVAKMLINLGRWDFLRVAGIISAPTMRLDGSILEDPGYDAETQLWHEPDVVLVMPPIPDKPTREQAEKALELLKDLLVGFPFVSNVDRSVALAAIMTAALRGAFIFAPIFLIVAPVAGTGKSFLVDLVSFIIRGRPCPVMSAASSNEEMEKRLGSIILESPPIISIDNISFDLKSNTHCSMTTQETVKPRILGKSLMPDCEWRGTMFITGNNVHVVGDLVRRTMMCTIDAGVDQPELRKFDFDPVDVILADRCKYIAAAITIAKAWTAAKQPTDVSLLNGFEDWSRAVRLPLMWLGEEDPVKSQEQARAEDPERVELLRLIEQWHSHLVIGGQYPVRQIIQVAMETRSAFGAPTMEYIRPDFSDLLRAKAGSLSKKSEIDPTRLGIWLNQIKGRVCSIEAGTFRIEVDRQKTHGNYWSLRQVEAEADTL
jgi:putative DNA primase/helicase